MKTLSTFSCSQVFDETKYNKNSGWFRLRKYRKVVDSSRKDKIKHKVLLAKI